MIKLIKSNVKKGVECGLGKNTLIVGSNGAGKSSIVNSVELLCGEFASDVMGRGILKKSGDLMVLSNDGKTLEVTGIVEDGGKTQDLKYKLVKTKDKTSKAKGNVSLQRKVNFPFLTVRENLTKSAEKARLWLLENIDTNLSAEDVIERFTAGEQANYKHRTAYRSGTQTDILLQVIESSKVKIREFQSEIRTLEKLRDESTMPTNEITQAQLDDLNSSRHQAREKLQEWQNEMKGLQNLPDPIKTRQEAEKYAQLAVKMKQDLQKQAQEFQASYPNWKTALPQAQKGYDVGMKIADAAQLHADLKASTCMVCQRNGSPDFGGIATKMRTSAQRFSDLLDAKSNLSRMQDNLQGLESQAHSLIADWKKADSMSHRITEIEEEEKVLKLNFEIIEEKYLKAIQVNEQWKQIRNLKDRISENESRLTKEKAFLTDAQNVASSLLASTVDKFIEKVNAHLPPSDHFYLDLGESNCRIGFLRDGQTVVALSGAEWARLILAIACATSKKDTLNIFIPEERAYDAKTLGEIMKALGDRKSGGQVILTSTVRPRKAKYLEQWTIIELT